MNALWWSLWAVELFAAVMLLFVVQYVRRKLRLAQVALKGRLERDAELIIARAQAAFWQNRSLDLEEKLRPFTRQRGAKGRFVGRCG